MPGRHSGRTNVWVSLGHIGHARAWLGKQACSLSIEDDPIHVHHNGHRLITEHGDRNSLGAPV